EDAAVTRCWTPGNIDTLSAGLREYNPGLIHIQYHTDFFSSEQLGRLLASFAGSAELLVTFHILPADLPVAALQECSHIRVHSKHDLKRLHGEGITRASLAVHGIPDVLPRSAKALRRKLGI